MLEWYFVGPVIGLIFFLFVYLGKSFGISTSFQTACSLIPGVNRLKYFQVVQKDHLWRNLFVFGAILGGLLGYFATGKSMMPEWYKSIYDLTWWQWLMFGVGGLFIGFGVRYAGGCTSGHAITGLSFLQWRSLVAVIGFFIGGLLVTHLLLNKLL